MTIPERCTAFQQAFPRQIARWPWCVPEQGREVLYGVWVIGQDYRSKTGFYGSYPPSYLDRVMALFPDVVREYNDFQHAGILHVFSGSLGRGTTYTTLDLNPACDPNYVGSVYDVAAIFQTPTVGPIFKLVIADPPYSAADAERYGTPPLNRQRAIRALAEVTQPGGHLCWLDTVWPIHSKRQWVTVGRILVQRSTNHRIRLLSIFERVAAPEADAAVRRTNDPPVPSTRA